MITQNQDLTMTHNGIGGMGHGASEETVQNGHRYSMQCIA